MTAAGATTTASDNNNITIHDDLTDPAAAALATSSSGAAAASSWETDSTSEQSAEGVASLSLSTSSSATQLPSHQPAGMGGAGEASSSTSSECGGNESDDQVGRRVCVDVGRTTFYRPSKNPLPPAQVDEEARAYVAGCFEGPEKTLEVCFKPGVGHPRGCRELTRAQVCRFVCRSLDCVFGRLLGLARVSPSHHTQRNATHPPTHSWTSCASRRAAPS